MNILMTGGTRLQANAIKVRQIQKLDVPAGIVQTLKDNGHRVHWAKIPLGEVTQEMEDADLLWVSVALGRSTNAPHLLGALWTIFYARTQDKPLVVFYDDWQSITIPKVYGSMLSKGLEQLTRLVWGKTIYDDSIKSMETNWSAISLVLEDFATGYINRYSVGVIPKFHNFGDISIVESKMPMSPTLYSVDPTPYAINDFMHHRFEGEYEDKEKGWFLASLMPHDGWVQKQNPSWPVTYVGSRKLKAPRLKTEFEVAQRYHDFVGVLSPEYPQAGSGWFRTRFLYSAAGLNVLSCGWRDANQFHRHSEAFLPSVREFEAMSLAQLEAHAHYQRDVIFEGMVSDTATTYRELCNIIAAAERKV